jgi:hypothetical protein
MLLLKISNILITFIMLITFMYGRKVVTWVDRIAFVY